MKKIFFLLANIACLLYACGNDQQTPEKPSAPVVEQPAVAEEEAETIAPAPAPPAPAKAPPVKDISQPEVQKPRKSETPLPTPPVSPVPDPETAVTKSGFSDVAALDRSIPLDIRYATADNFTKAKIYDCPRCLLRPEAAKAIVKAHKSLQKKGLALKMFDCYRPRPYQQRLWNKVPNPDYVTPPAKGSMHSRGAAVDLTIVNAAGKELDMGTPYDFFGKEAHTDNLNLPAQVLANRRLLRETLEAVGFKGIRTEWWHFSYPGKTYPLSDYVWPCN